MAWPGYPDSFDPGWWRIQVITPPVFTGTGNLSLNSNQVLMFSATYQGQAITPLPGQQVSGAGIPAGTVVAASPPPTSTAFFLSAQSMGVGIGVTLTIGAEPVTLAEALAWARVEFNDENSLIADIITATREEIEGPGLKRAVMLQSRCIYFMGFPWTGGYYNRLIRSMGPNPWWLPTAQGIIMLPYPPLQAVTSIKYVDPSLGTLLTIDPTTYLFTTNSTPGRVMPQYGKVWPLARPVIDAVQITYTCGYGALETDVPASTRIAMRQMIAAAYEDREAFMEVGISAIPQWQRFRSVEDYGVYV